MEGYGPEQNPDEFGMMPREQHSVDPTDTPGIQRNTDEPPISEIKTYREDVLEPMRRYIRNMMEEEFEPAPRHVFYIPRLHGLENYYGSASPAVPEAEPAQEPVEKPDPYPSRAGWRCAFLPPHDPLAEEPADKPKGRIGEYDTIESAITFDDIGGNQKAKGVLLEIAAQFETPELYTRWDVPVPKGVILYGGPGTGKTMLAKAFANKARALFVEVPVASLRDKYYGESEKKLRNLFAAAAERREQVVIFFDEIDSLLPDRSLLVPNSPDAQIVNTFLQAMDGMQSARNVMVLGATNYLGRLDDAATRPGRFDEKVEVKPPDDDARQEIAAKRLLSAERSAGRVLVEDELDLAAISAALPGATGAVIAEVINRVKRSMAQTERAMRSGVTIDELGVTIDFGSSQISEVKITTHDIVAAAIKYYLEG